MAHQNQYLPNNRVMTPANGITTAIIPMTSITHRNALNMLISLSSVSTRVLDETIRDSDKRFRDGFFSALLVCTVAVLIGVVLEEAEIFPLPFRRSWIDSNTGLTVINHKLDKWLKVIARIGWLLIIFGVLGEGVFEELAAQADSILQRFDEIITEDAQRVADTAESQNLELSIELEQEKGIVATASRKASEAEKGLASARKEAADEAAKLTTETERTGRLEAQLSWRTVTTEQKDAIRGVLMAALPSKPELFPLKGWTIEFQYPMGCIECEAYTDDLTDAIGGLGEIIPTSSPSASVFGPHTPEGVWVSVNPLDANSPMPLLLLKAFSTHGIDAQGESNPNAVKGTISITVGIKRHAANRSNAPNPP